MAIDPVDQLHTDLGFAAVAPQLRAVSGVCDKLEKLQAKASSKGGFAAYKQFLERCVRQIQADEDLYLSGWHVVAHGASDDEYTFVLESNYDNGYGFSRPNVTGTAIEAADRRGIKWEEELPEINRWHGASRSRAGSRTRTNCRTQRPWPAHSTSSISGAGTGQRLHLTRMSALASANAASAGWGAMLTSGR